MVKLGHICGKLIFIIYGIKYSRIVVGYALYYWFLRMYFVGITYALFLVFIRATPT